MPVKDSPQEEVKETPKEETPALTPDEAVAIYSKGLQDKLNARYASLAKRLESESNIIIRYELKLSQELLINVYKDLFSEGK